MINEINSLSNNWIKKEMKVRNIPVLINHVPLFYLLPEDGTSMEFRYLREEWKISKSSLSDLLHKYEALGYIAKDTRCQDKRCVMIGLTSKGLQLKEQFLEIEACVLNTMLAGYSEVDRLKLENDIVNILNNLKKD